MSLENQEFCCNCIYWTGDKNKKTGTGQCRRLPPSPAGIVPAQNMLTQQMEPRILSAFPTSNANDYCGMWEQAQLSLDS